MKLSPGKAFVRKHYLKAIAVLALLFIISLFFNISVKAIFVMSAFIIAGSFSTFYFNYARVPIHLETVKLGTILCAVAYGIYPGIVVGIIATFFGKVLVGRIDEKLPLSMVTISLVAVAAGLFSAADITLLGIVIVLFYNIVMFLLTHFLGGDLAWNLPYETSNFLVNLFWFTRIAPWLIVIIK